MVLLVEYGQLGTVKMNLNATCCVLWTSMLHEEAYGVWLLRCKWVQLGIGVSHGLDMMQVCTGAKSEQQSKLAARKVGPCY